jgi:hypothetical protein
MLSTQEIYVMKNKPGFWRFKFSWMIDIPPVRYYHFMQDDNLSVELTERQVNDLVRLIK